MTLKAKLSAGFISIFLLMAVLLGIVVGMLNEQNRRMNDLVEDRYRKIHLINQVRYDIANTGSELIFIEQGITDQEGINAIRQSEISIAERINDMENMIHQEKSKQFLFMLDHQYAAYENTVEQIIAAYKNGDMAEISKLMVNAGTQRSQLIAVIGKFVAFQEKAMQDTVNSSQQSYTEALRLAIAAAIGGLLLGIGFAIWVIRSVSRSLIRVIDVMKHIEYGSLQLPRIELTSKDEIGEIAHAFNEMAGALERHERAQQEYEEAMQADSELKSQVAELNALTQGILDVAILGRQYINKITPMVGASYGVLYKKEEFPGADRLIRLASYAAENPADRVGEASFQLGEGLVGQCAAENREIWLERVPDQYIKIHSGLGQAPPASVIVLPVAFEGEVLAVMELASFGNFTAMHRALLSQSADYLGVTLNRIEKHMQVQELLKESQAINEELQTQSEELQQQQEELRTINDELEAQNKVSEQRNLDLEAIRTELEEKARQVELGSKYKSEFLANVSHELRTPLNSLLILAKVLLDNQEGNLTGKQVEYARTIYSSGNDLLQLINDILDLSKIESGKMDIHYDDVHLDDIMEYCNQQFKLIAKEQKLDFFIHKQNDLPKKIRSDALRLIQILKNLLANAFKFTEKGSVSLELRSVKDHETGGREPEMVAFSVSDTGIGIPADKQHIIFEAFNQADGTTSRKYGGTGLGLSICRELADLLGGYIEVESEEGKGSTFTLFLPMREAAFHPGVEEAAAAAADRGEDTDYTEINAPEEDYPLVKEVLTDKNILIVDDDMRNVYALTSALESAGMKVQFAENGKEAIDKLEKHAGIHLILMDIMMPDMDGYEAIVSIRSMTQYQSLPIIALTAKAMKQDRQKCMDVGASDYISKPINMEQLFSMLKVWLYDR